MFSVAERLKVIECELSDDVPPQGPKIFLKKGVVKLFASSSLDAAALIERHEAVGTESLTRAPRPMSGGKTLPVNSCPC